MSLLRVNRKRQRLSGEGGFTLVEVLMALTVVVLVLTAVVSGVSFSVKNTRVSKERAEAVRRGQETMEWLKGLRNAEGFRVLYDTIASDGQTVDYCLTSLPTTMSEFSNLSSGHCGLEDYVTGTNLFRELHVVLTPPGLISADVNVTWDEGSVTQISTLRTEIRDWK